MKAEFTTKQMIEIKSENLAEARMLADLADNPDLQIRQLRSDSDHNADGIITTALVLGWTKREPALTPAKQKALYNEALELAHLSQLLEWQQDLTNRRLDVIKKELEDEAVKAPVVMFKSAAERVHQSEDQPEYAAKLSEMLSDDLSEFHAAEKVKFLNRHILNCLFSGNYENELLQNGTISKNLYNKIKELLDRSADPKATYLIYGKDFREFIIVANEDKTT